MSESLGEISLPNLEVSAMPAPAPVPAAKGLHRVKPVDRSQMVLQTVDVEQLIEEDHPARAIWEFVGQLDLSPFYSSIEAVEGVAGRQAWDPRLLMSVWIYAYSRGISSAREICRRCQYEPAFQWLAGLQVINYHTLSDFRTNQKERLEQVFVEVLGVLSSEGLVSLERVTQDGTKIKAYASKKSFRGEEHIQEHLEIARQQVKAMEAQAENYPQKAARQRAVKERDQRLTQAKAELDKIRQSKAAEDQASVRVSCTDPQARIMKQPDGGYAPSYNVQLSTDAAAKIIVAVSVSQSGNDYPELLPAVEQIEQNLQKKPQQIIADGGYTCRPNIVDIAAEGIDFYGSMPEPNPACAGQLERRGISPDFLLPAFTYDPQQDTYQCPAGQLLRPKRHRQRPGRIDHEYRAAPQVCANCSLRSKCCPQNPKKGRSITRIEDTPEVQQFIEKMATREARDIYRQRSAIAEFPNAWIKDKLRLRQFRLRGVVKVHAEALWATLTYNIQQWIRLSWLKQEVEATT